MIPSHQPSNTIRLGYQCCIMTMCFLEKSKMIITAQYCFIRPTKYLLTQSYIFSHLLLDPNNNKKIRAKCKTSKQHKLFQGNFTINMSKENIKLMFICYFLNIRIHSTFIWESMISDQLVYQAIDLFSVFINSHLLGCVV